jgi:hypothetical protein
MLIVGLDYHPSVQQIAFLDLESGEFGERQLNRNEGEVEEFYRELKQRGIGVRVGMEATGNTRWFERVMMELGFELWIGDRLQIRRRRVRKQKTDRRDAHLLLKLMVEDRFPRVWVPSPENRDVRQLLWHRHRLVQMRTRIMNQLQAVALNEGVRRKKALWGKEGRAQLESFLLFPWATRRRQDLLELLDRLKPIIADLNAAVQEEAERRPQVRRLMTHPGDTRMEAIGGSVFRRSLSEVKDAIYEENVATMKADLAQLKAEHAKAQADRKAKLQGKINQLDSRIQAQVQKAKERGEAVQCKAQAKVQVLKAKAGAERAKAS